MVHQGMLEYQAQTPFIPPRNLPPNPPSNDRGDVLIRSFLSRQTDYVLDVQYTNSDVPSAISTDLMRHLNTHKTSKMTKYLKHCLKQRWHFAPYVVDCYGLFGMEARAANTNLLQN